MPRPRDRQSATGLLPRMEARTRKDGQITYRFHPLQPDGTRGHWISSSQAIESTSRTPSTKPLRSVRQVHGGEFRA